jgi:hypothetical protein
MNQDTQKNLSMPISQAPKRKALSDIELEHFQNSDYAGAQPQLETG